MLTRTKTGSEFRGKYDAYLARQANREMIYFRAAQPIYDQDYIQKGSRLAAGPLVERCKRPRIPDGA